MKHRINSLLLLAVLLWPALAPSAFAKLSVVATIPDLAEFAQRIGGEHVEVKSLATGAEGLHAVPLKPSFAVLLNRADILVLLGLEAEHAFLPALLEASRNPKIARGAAGYVDCSTYVSVLDAPALLDRALGDQHPMGNPHYNLDPVAMKLAARAMQEGFSRAHPEYDSAFKSNLATVEADLDVQIARWEREAAPLNGRKFVSYHPDLDYFAARFGMVPTGTIEIRAGIDPTPGHIEALIDRMKSEHVDVVIRERHYPAGLADTIAQRTGARLVELPVMVGGAAEARDYVALIDHMLRALTAAAEGGT